MQMKGTYIFSPKQRSSAFEIPETQLILPASSSSKTRITERALPKARQIFARQDDWSRNFGWGSPGLIFDSAIRGRPNPYLTIVRACQQITEMSKNLVIAKRLKLL